MASHPFFTKCKQIIDKELSIRNYIEKEFITFFSSLYSFLQQFQKPIKTGLFQKNPLKTLMMVLGCVEDIISITSYNDYKITMIDDMTSCFLAILHPKNYFEIRNFGVKVTYILINVLSGSSEKYTKGFITYMFDFSSLQPYCKEPSNLLLDIPNDLRIQINDNQMKDKYHLISHIAFLFNEMKRLPQNSFLSWWKIVQKQILSVCYRAHDAKTISYGINGPCPIEIHALIRDMVQSFFDQPSLFFEILNIEHSAVYFFMLLRECAFDYIDEIQSYDFVLKFMGFLYKDNTEILKHICICTPELLQIGIGSLIKTIDHIFVKGLNIKNPSNLNQVTECLSRFFEIIVPIIAQDHIFLILKTIINHSLKGGVFSVIYVIMCYFALVVNNCIALPKSWLVMPTNMGINSSQFCHIISVFVSWYSFLNIEKILGFSFDDLNFIENKSFSPFLEGYLNDPNKSFCDNCKTICVSSVADFFIENKIVLPSLHVEKQSYSFVLSFLDTIIESFKWQTLNEDEKLNYYLIESSIYYTLLQISQSFPEKVNYNAFFFVKRLSEWIEYGLKPSCNDSVMLCSLLLIDSFFNNHQSCSLVSIDQLRFLYNLLPLFMSNKRDRIKQIAISISVKLMLNRFKESNLLLTNTLEYFQTKNEYLSFPSITSFLLQSYNLISCDKSDQTNTLLSKIIQFVSSLPSPLKAFSVAFLLIQECSISESRIFDQLIGILEITLQSLNVFDVYSIELLIPHLKDIELIKNGSIEKLLGVLLNILTLVASKTPSLLSDYLNIFVDFLINSSTIIDCFSIYTSFHVFSNDWMKRNEINKTDNDLRAYMKNFVMFLDSYYSIGVKETSQIKNDNTVNCVLSNKDHIIGITESYIVSNKYIGRFKWNFKPAYPTEIIEDHSSISKDNWQITPNPSGIIQLDNDQKYLDIMKSMGDYGFSLSDPSEYEACSLEREECNDSVVINRLRRVKDDFKCVSSAFLNSIGLFNQDSKFLPPTSEFDQSQLDNLKFTQLIYVICADNSIQSLFGSSLSPKNEEMCYFDLRKTIVFNKTQGCIIIRCSDSKLEPQFPDKIHIDIIKTKQQRITIRITFPKDIQKAFIFVEEIDLIHYDHSFIISLIYLLTSFIEKIQNKSFNPFKEPETIIKHTHESYFSQIETPFVCQKYLWQNIN